MLEGLAPEAWVELHPDDAAALGVASGDLVDVESARGRVEAIRARVTSIVRRGEVFIPFHWEERCANRLTIGEFDPVSREPNFKQCAVRVHPRGRARQARPRTTMRGGAGRAVTPRSIARRSRAAGSWR